MIEPVQYLLVARKDCQKLFTFNENTRNLIPHVSLQGYVKSLMHIRHENIVSYMGASMDSSQEVIQCTIITNPVQSESLHSKLSERHGTDLDVSAKMSIAKQVGAIQ